MPEPMPAPRVTATSAPSALNFLTVSGVAATRGSPASVSRATAIRIHVFPAVLNLVRRQPGEGKDGEAEREGDVARRLAAGHQTRDQADDGDNEDQQRRQPVSHDAASREA